MADDRVPDGRGRDSRRRHVRRARTAWPAVLRRWPTRSRRAADEIAARADAGGAGAARCGRARVVRTSERRLDAVFSTFDESPRRVRHRAEVSARRAAAARAGAPPRRGGRARRDDRHSHARRDGLGRALRRSGRRVLPLRDDARLAAAAPREAARGQRGADRSLSGRRGRARIARYTERARDALRYIQNWLADPVDGGWGGLAAADARVRRRHRPTSTARARPPQVDRMLFADWNAAMVVGRAARRARVRRRRARAFRAEVARARAARRATSPARASRTTSSGETPGRAASSPIRSRWRRACLDAFEATGNIVYEMMAEELAHHAIRAMWDERARRLLRPRAEPAEPRRSACCAVRSSPFAPTVTRRHAAPARGDLGRRTNSARVRPTVAGGDRGVARWPGPAGRALPARRAGRAVSGDTLRPVMTETSVADAPQRRHPAPHRFRAVHERSGQRPSDELPVGRRDRRDAVLRRDALRSEGPAEPRQRSVRAVEGARRADSVRGVGRSRAVPARGAAEAAAHRHRISRGTRRRGCRSSTSPPARSVRASAPRSAPR